MFLSRTFLTACALAVLGALSSAASGQVVISQIYAGAGVSGATYNYQYIELFNRGPVAVDLSTWSVQYAGAGQFSWGQVLNGVYPNKTNLTGVIPAGGYYLVREAFGTGSSLIPVTPDDVGAIAMTFPSGKVALVANQNPLGNQHYFAPGMNGVVDFVCYGTPTAETGAANYGFEGSGPTGAGLSGTTAVYRKNGGCTDTNDNSADFDPPTDPLPRNSASPTNPCTGLNPSGACCRSNGTCVYVTSSTCVATPGATYAGDYVPCAPGSYTLASTPQTFIDISAAGTDITGTGGDNYTNPPAGTAAFVLPFGVNFYGQTFSNFRVDGNGWMSLCPSFAHTANANQTTFPFGSLPLAILAPYWDDLSTASTTSGRIYSRVSGSVGSRQFIVMWKTVPYFTAAGTGNNTFEVIFNEGTQVIEFRYGTIIAQGAAYGGAGGTSVASFGAGIQDLSAAFGVNVDPVGLGTGGASAARQFTPTGECPATGACCRSGSCFATTALGCTVGAGDYRGTGTSCATQSCSSGACCRTDGSCAEAQTPLQCTAMGGLYQNNNSVCSAVTCPAIGSCCTGPNCTMTFSAAHGQCTSGTWTNGGSCTTNPCGGSCCNVTTNACYLTVDATSCGIGSTFSGLGSTCQSNPCPPPINDDCFGALPISANVSIVGGNESATNDVAPECGFINFHHRGVWYVFTPSTSRQFEATTCSPNTTFNTSVSVYDGFCGALRCINSNADATPACASRADASTVQWCGTAGVSYYILVANPSILSDNGDTGVFGLRINELNGFCPPNDLCENATAITVGSSTPGTVINATPAGQPTGFNSSCNGEVALKPGVWYTFTSGPTPQRLSANLCDPITDYDAMIFAYTGSCGALTCVWSNDTSAGCPIQGPLLDVGNAVHTNIPAILNWNPDSTAPGAGVKCTIPNTTYYLLVTTNISSAGAPGGFVLHLDDTGETCEGTPPTHNLCPGARTLSGFPYWRQVFRGDALSSPDVPCNSPTSTDSQGSIWYTYTPTEPGSFFHAKIPDQGASGAATNTVITVFSSATDCATLTEIACLDAVEGYVGAFTTPVTHLAAGTKYYAEVSSFNDNSVANPAAEWVGFNFVADPGACCHGTVCAVTNGVTACTSGAGVFRGYGTTCSPTNPCAPAAGLCCRGATCNTTITQANCTTTGALAGAIFHSGTTCGGSTFARCCYGDYNKQNGLSVQDIFDFLNDWFAGSRFAIAGGDGVTGTLNVQNIFDFLNAWFAGCS